MYDNPSLSRASDMSRNLPGARGTPPVIEPQDRIAAWKRWEMTSFRHELSNPAQQTAATPEPLQPSAPLPTPLDEDELDRLRLEARIAGEKLGYQQGYLQGQAKGHEAAMAAVDEQARQLQALALSLPTALHIAEEGVANDLLALAMDLARQVLGKALEADPQSMLTVVHELLQAEPALVGSPQLFLHPDDAKLVSELMAEDLQLLGWRIRCDANILRGGCKVTAASGERDATLETRWEQVATALARNTHIMTGATHG